ncbi:Osmosensitive K+ channel histidine kinase KdpD [Minicystis rosea]|nr:Osmosensitive K+ channel histidine kinase KdpD [Minicystis rosea]
MKEAAVSEHRERLEIAGVDGPLRLEELIDRNALREMIESSARIFGVPMRVLGGSGAVIAGPIQPSPLTAILEDEPAASVVRAAAEEPLAGSGGVLVGTLVARTGELYRVVPVEYDRYLVGRIVLGPYAIPTDVEPPAALASAFPGVEAERLRVAWSSVCRLEAERVVEIGAHLATVLEVMLFSGHKALLTSQMHLASVRESYRELTEKNDRLEEAYERLKELDRLKSNFLATVSHELRTPLTSIMGYGEMLAEGVAGALNDEQREFVETIRNKSEQLLGLIMSLLDMSKLEHGTMPVRMARLSIGAVLEEAVSTLMPTATKKGVAISLDVPDVPAVLGDADRLRQVFINLTDNAVKFTPPQGHVVLSARLTVDRAHNEPGLVLVAPLRPMVEIRVSDTGVGIAEEEREKVFDPFYQIDQSSTREYGGAGLGLAIVKRLVDAHQGSIWVEANTPHGAVFVVSLPASRPSVTPPPPRTPNVPPSSPDSLPPIFG